MARMILQMSLWEALSAIGVHQDDVCLGVCLRWFGGEERAVIYLPVKGMMAVFDLDYRLSKGVVVALETVVEQFEDDRFLFIFRDME